MKWAARGVWMLVIAAIVIGVLYTINRYFDDEPVTYELPEDHFKYGSTGGERGYKKQFGFGFPYWIFVALPEMFPEYLPDREAGGGYSSFGLVYEEGKDPRFDLPVGMSMRRRMGIDRVYFNCAVCHTGTVRESVDAQPAVVLGMPAHQLKFGELIEFLQNAGTDWRFESSRMLPAIETLANRRDEELPAGDGYRPERLSWLDEVIFDLFAVSMMRDELLRLLGRLEHMNWLSWGAGRVDTFNSPKPLLGFRMDTAPSRELIGVADLPSVWNQKWRRGMSLHWDGNNCSVDERNLSAGFGTGATPTTLDRDKVLRTADWLWEDAQPARFPADRIDAALAAQGEPIYAQYCWNCHGNRTTPFRTQGDGGLVGTVTPIDEIGTDRWRLDSYTPELAQAQNTIYAGYPEDAEACRAYVDNVCNADQPEEEYRALREQCYPARFSHFRKTWGYANMPLDGLWLRAPYLHNGSVPNLRALLSPSPRRPKLFYAGYDVYDYDNVGFVTTGRPAAAAGFKVDTRVAGNGNSGHEGAEYGTQLSAEEKSALLEYLKTF